MTSFSFNYLLKNPVSKQSHSQLLGVKTSTQKFEGGDIIQLPTVEDVRSWSDGDKGIYSGEEQSLSNSSFEQWNSLD